MAIGSDPEVGVKFARWGDMDGPSRQAWYEYIKSRWGTHLLGGFATLHQPDPDRILHFHEMNFLDVTC